MNLQTETRFLKDYKNNKNGTPSILYKSCKALLEFAKQLADRLEECEEISKDDHGHYYWRASGERV